MSARIRAEFLGLRTLRSGYVVPMSLVALSAVIAGLFLVDAGSVSLRTPAQLREPVVARAGLLTAVALSIFAALLVAGHWRHRTITHRLLASPRRQQTLAAALLTYGVLSLAVVAVALLASVAVAQALISSKHLSLGLSAGVVAGVLLSVVLFTSLGVSVGVITRNQPAAVGRARRHVRRREDPGHLDRPCRRVPALWPARPTARLLGSRDLTRRRGGSRLPPSRPASCCSRACF